MTGPPRLEPFGLVLHRDGRWTHEGAPIRNRKLRAAFDRGVRYLPEEGVYVVQLGRFRGRIELEEAGFFVTGFDAAEGRVRLSDGSQEPLDVTGLHPSPQDGAWLCTVKRALAPGGLAARFLQAAQAELLAAVEDTPQGPGVCMAGSWHPLPACLLD